MTRAEAWRNWAGTQTAMATAVAHPASTDELVNLVRIAAGSGGVIKPVGSGHSFTGTAATSGVRVELSGMSGLVAVDRDGRLARVRAGTPLADLNQVLHAHGLALPNLGDIDTQTISGALATGTHGTGARFGCLATFVEELELVTGTGEVLRCSATSHPEIFAAARVGVGALGIITELTLRCVDAFVLRAQERPMPLAQLLAEIDERVAGNDHVEFYWFPYTERTQLKTNNRVPSSDRPLPRWREWLDDELLANTVFGLACRLGRLVPASVPAISGVSARALAPRAYTDRSDRVFTSPRRVRFVEMEYGLPRAALPEAFAGLRRVIGALPSKVVFPVEVRFTAADDIWLSHGYGRDSVYIAIHQFVGMPYEEYFRAFEAVCIPLGGRPHWGKMHWRDAASLVEVYPRFAEFLAVRDDLDPERVFANAYTRQVFGS
jgi:L-gulono-1,4-lactone dehydrogenase